MQISKNEINANNFNSVEFDHIKKQSVTPYTYWREILGLFESVSDPALMSDQFSVLHCDGEYGEVVNSLQNFNYRAKGFDSRSKYVMENISSSDFRKDNILDMSYYNDNEYALVIVSGSLHRILESEVDQAFRNLYRVSKKWVYLDIITDDDFLDIFNRSRDIHSMPEGEWFAYNNIYIREWWEERFKYYFEYVEGFNPHLPENKYKFPLQVKKGNYAKNSNGIPIDIKSLLE